MELPAASGGESIKVFVRVRPPDPNLESDLDRSVCLDVTSQSSLTVHCKPEPKVFTFDHVAAMHTTQEDVFTSVGRPIIDSCMCGYNGTVFAYGQTGSGKTFTMIGPSDDSNNFTHELRGIIPRSFEYLFSLINREKQKYGELVDFLCKCSFLEIYNEQVYDLVDPASCGLHLRENIKHGVYVDGLLETSVASAREAYEVLSTGWANRRVAATSMNRESSRSHAVFTLTVESKKREGKDSVAKLKSSVLNLVDLAGSERQRDTQTAGVRLKEAGSINKSLSALGNVIMALVDIAHGKSRHVHYRDSKLTFLLRDSLGGNAKTNLVANVHPNARCFGESLSTLNFARRAKMIKNKAVVNEDATGNVLQLQAEIRRLKEQLEKFRAGTGEFPLSSPSLPVSSLDYITRDGLRSDDEKAIQELKEMLASSMSARDKTDKDQAMLLDRVESLQKLCKQKDSFLQSTKMILKFRETHIANLEKAKQSETSADSDQQAAISLLRQEIDQLKYMVNHHPDVSKFAHETIDLKAEIKRLQGVASGGQNLSRDLARTHKYTLQLERQLRHFLGKGDGSSSSDSSSLKRPSPSSSHSNAIHLEARCKQLQGELDRTRKSLNSEREDFHIRETKLEASLTATKKANLELERSIEALKLKNSVEKATLNDVHMNTIKSMLTPRRDLIQARRSVSSTSFGMHRADSDPLNNQQFSLSFNGAISTPTRPITIVDTPNRLEKKHDISSLTTNPRLLALHEANRVQSLDNGSVPSGGFSTPRMTKEVVVNDEGEELNIEGALTDELKIVQDKNRHLQQQIEDLELKVFRLSQDKTSLEVQLKELTQLYHSEHETMQTMEHDYLDKISDLTSQIATLTSNTTVLDSEVVDLRICLRSADKEIAELKADRKEQRHTQEVKFMEHMQRIAELEQLVSTQAAGWDRSTEELQNLQDEVETLREELTFKDHRLTELGQVAVREKEQGGALEKEVQGLLEKLASEVEKNTRLSCELQEGSQGKEELVAMVSENSKLKSEVEQLETELRSQLTTYKQELEKAEVTINSLMTRQSSDEAAITGFMTTVQELRGACATSEAKAISLSKEVEDSNNELSSAAVKIDQLTSELTTLRTQLSEQAFHHERQLRKNETEHEVILDDLDRLNEQYQQLQEAFGTQSKCLKEAQCETQRLQEDLTEKDTELARIHLQQREKRESLTRIQPAEKDWAFTVEEKTEEIEELKQKLDHAADMINMYEAGREEKNKELQTLKDELTSVEHVGEENRNLHAQLTTLQYKLSFTEDHLQKTEEHLREEFEEGLARVEQLEKDYTSAVQSKDKARRESANLQDKCQGQRNSIDALTQQLARYKTHEEALFLEKESLRSQLEAIQEEQSKLSKECEKLAKENAAITGHQNIRQKIQYHATVKIENSKLKEEVIQLRSRLKRKNDQVAQLHQLLTEKETQPPSDGGKNTVSNRKMLSSQKTFSDSEMAVKENLSPF